MMIPSFCLIENSSRREREIERHGSLQGRNAAMGTPISFEEQAVLHGCIATAGAASERNVIVMRECIEWLNSFSFAVASSRNARRFEELASDVIASRPWGVIACAAAFPPWSTHVASVILRTAASAWAEFEGFRINTGWGQKSIPAPTWIETRLHSIVPDELWVDDSSIQSSLLKTALRIDALSLSQRAHIIMASFSEKQSELEKFLAWEVDVGGDMVTFGHLEQPHLFSMQLERYHDDISVVHSFVETDHCASLAEVTRSLKDEAESLDVVGKNAELRLKNGDGSDLESDILQLIHCNSSVPAVEFIVASAGLELLSGSIRFRDAISRRTCLEVVPSGLGLAVRRRAR